MVAVNPSYVGLDMVLAYNSAGVGLGPTFVTINCRDLKRGLTMGEGDVSNRGSKEELAEPALRKREFAFDIVTDQTDASFTFLQSAFFARTPIVLRCTSPRGQELMRFEYINRIEHEDGSSHCYNVTGRTARSGAANGELTVFVRTID